MLINSSREKTMREQDQTPELLLRGSTTTNSQGRFSCI